MLSFLCSSLCHLINLIFALFLNKCFKHSIYYYIPRQLHRTLFFAGCLSRSPGSSHNLIGFYTMKLLTQNKHPNYCIPHYDGVYNHYNMHVSSKPPTLDGKQHVSLHLLWKTIHYSWEACPLQFLISSQMP
jgi:hypothetical protein